MSSLFKGVLYGVVTLNAIEGRDVSNRICLLE